MTDCFLKEIPYEPGRVVDRIDILIKPFVKMLIYKPVKELRVHKHQDMTRKVLGLTVKSRRYGDSKLFCDLCRTATDRKRHHDMNNIRSFDSFSDNIFVGFCNSNVVFFYYFIYYET